MTWKTSAGLVFEARPSWVSQPVIPNTHCSL